jgi:hypothetical protein
MATAPTSQAPFASAGRKPESDDLYVIIGKAGIFIGRTWSAARVA